MNRTEAAHASSLRAGSGPISPGRRSATRAEHDQRQREDPRDVFSLGRVYERAALYERSEDLYRRVLDQETGPLRVATLVRLAARAKRSGDHDSAADLWGEAAAAGNPRAWRELAVHHEHRTRDLYAALAAAEVA